MTRPTASSLCAHLAAMLLGLSGGEALASAADAEDPARRSLATPPRLGDALARLTPLAQTEVVCTWAEGSFEQRLAVALALADGPEVVGARSALDALSVDPDGRVREAAGRALAAYARR